MKITGTINGGQHEIELEIRDEEPLIRDLMAAMVAGASLATWEDVDDGGKSVARTAYQVADALMAERPRAEIERRRALHERIEREKANDPHPDGSPCPKCGEPVVNYDHGEDTFCQIEDCGWTDDGKWKEAYRDA